jgi:hypothetical protein
MSVKEDSKWGLDSLKKIVRVFKFSEFAFSSMYIKKLKSLLNIH